MFFVQSTFSFEKRLCFLYILEERELAIDFFANYY